MPERASPIAPSPAPTATADAGSGPDPIATAARAPPGRAVASQPGRAAATGTSRDARIERARALYREGAPVRDICAATGFSTGTLYYHLDGQGLPGLVPPRIPRRRRIDGHASAPMPSRGRQRLAARLWRATERQARKIELSLEIGFHQNLERRTHDLQALREIARILKELSAFEDAPGKNARAAGRAGYGGGRGAVEHEQALAVEGRAVVISRTRRG